MCLLRPGSDSHWNLFVCTPLTFGRWSFSNHLTEHTVCACISPRADGKSLGSQFVVAFNTLVLKSSKYKNLPVKCHRLSSHVYMQNISSF